MSPGFLIESAALITGCSKISMRSLELVWKSEALQETCLKLSPPTIAYKLAFREAILSIESRFHKYTSISPLILNILHSY